MSLACPITPRRRTALPAWLVLAGALLAAPLAQAQPQPPSQSQQQPPQMQGQGPGGRQGADGDRGRPPPPPPEALEACKTGKANDPCSFTSPHGKLTGTCFAPQGMPLACRPKGPPPQGGGAPDQQGRGGAQERGGPAR